MVFRECFAPLTNCLRGGTEVVDSPVPLITSPGPSHHWIGPSESAFPRPHHWVTPLSESTVPQRPQSHQWIAPYESTVPPRPRPQLGIRPYEPTVPRPHQLTPLSEFAVPSRPRSQLGTGFSAPTPPTLSRRGSDSSVRAIFGDRPPVQNFGGAWRNPPRRLSNYVVDPTAAYEMSTVNASTRLTFDVSSDAFTPLKSVVSGLSAILKHYDQAMANPKITESLIPRVKGLAESLSTPAPEGETKEIERRRALRSKLEKALKALGPLAERGEIMGFLNAKDAETFTGLTEDIRDAMMDYQTALQQDIYHKNHQLIDAADRSLLNTMHHTAEAGYLCGDRNGCLKGTRKEVLLQIEQWLTDENDRRVFWLNGFAGTGKSTIAQTFAEIGFADGKLGASFFCSRDFEDRNNLQFIFPTLAFQLAYRYPEFRTQLLQVLKANPDVGRETLCSQLEKVIIHPLKATKISTLIIIDALDECKDKEPASALLSVLSRYVHEIPDAKFFITGRPEPPIREGFRLESLRPITDVLRLHDVKPSSVDEDIRLYLRTHLTNIPKTRAGCEFPEEWPSPYDIEILCKKAAGLFIYASTAVKFISSKHHLPTERLDLIILGSQGASHEGGIDLLYTQILRLAFQDIDSTDQEVYSRFRTIVGAVLLVFHPLSRKALSDLVRNCGTPSHIFTTLNSLHSLLNVPDSKDDPIRVFHKSFPDFLTDRTRCKDDRFFVNPSVHHENILFSCLDLMKKRLKKNICDLDDYVALSEVQDIFTRRDTYIGASLEYACRFWTKHLANTPGSGPHVKRVREALDEFFTKRLLCWIEVLSIMGYLGVAVYAISEIRQWYISANISTSEQADDSERFVLEHFDVIHDYPSHIYHTALPLSPSSTWLRKCYEAELAQGVKVLVGLPDRWDTCSRTVLVEDEPSAFAYRKDIIAVGSNSGRVVLLDAITGSRKSVLSSNTSNTSNTSDRPRLLLHPTRVSSLAFSLDGSLLVSSDKSGTLNLWDLQTGGVIKTRAFHTVVSAVAISPDCTTIASGTREGAINLWDIRTGQGHPTVSHHSKEVTAISFSPINPRRLISSSSDKTVRRWDSNGHQIGAPFHQTGMVEDVAYASDGTRFVSCGERFATVRDSETGAVEVELGVPNKLLLFRCCCFSPDGRFVACAAQEIYVWDIANSNARLVGTLVGHSGSVISIAFSSSLISVSPDKSVKFWQGSSFPTDPTPTGTTPTQVDSTRIMSVHLFVEEDTAVATNSSGEVTTWALATGARKSSFYTPARGFQDVHLLGNTLTVVWWAADDQEYRVWDAVNNQLVRTVQSSLHHLRSLKISGDGSKVFGLGHTHIEAWLMQTGEGAGLVPHGCSDVAGSAFVVDGSRVWLRGPMDVGWDFGGRGVSTFSPSKEFSDKPRLNLVESTQPERGHRRPRVQDTFTGKDIFCIPERCTRPGTVNQWDGRYLLYCSGIGDMVVFDFDCVCPL